MSHSAFISTLVREQLPEFIRADYETFIAFIEAYYQYLEQENKATDFGKHLLQYQDVDTTLDEFEEYFLKSFLPLLPSTTIVDKAFLIKHAKQFYGAKGTEKAFKFLFRALYGEEITLDYPKNYILRTSDGKWSTQKSLRFEREYYNTATGTGTTTQFILAEIIQSSDDLSVYINGVLQSSGYSTSLNAARITFATAPALDSTLKFVYQSLDIVTRLNSTLIVEFTGTISGATAVSETSNETLLSGVSSLEVFISNQSTTEFNQGEIVTAPYYYSTTEYLTLSFTLLSVVGSISVVNGGASYNVNDVLVITGGSPSTTANAVIESVYSALITNIIIAQSGAGFLSGGTVIISSTPNTGLTMAISAVDTSGNSHPSTLTINSDIISLYSNVVINSSDYEFPISGAETTATRVIDALSFTSLDSLGPITDVDILTSTFAFSTLPTLDASSPTLSFSSANATGSSANSILKLTDLGILGHMNVVAGGTGYTVGDDVVFSIPGYIPGWGAAAEVVEIHATATPNMIVANNGIKVVKFQPPRLDGTVSTANAGVSVVGVGTNFDGTLIVGNRIEINNESRYVSAIANATHLTVNVAWTRTSTARSIGIHGLTFIGGENYQQAFLPTTSIVSANSLATGANVVVDAIYGDGEDLTPVAEFLPGEIRTIAVTNPGSGYTSAPDIDLTGSGNGLATAIANLLTSKFTYPGKFLTTDGLLSSDRRLENKEYYQNFAYVIRSKVNFSTYKQVLLDLLHPTGMKVFAEYLVDETITQNTAAVSTAEVSLYP